MNNKQPNLRWLSYVPHALVLWVLVWFLHLLQPILLPFLVSAAFAYLGDPIVDRLEARGLGRTLGVSLVFVFLTLVGLIVLLLVLPMLLDQMQVLAERLPKIIQEIQATIIPYLNNTLGLDLSQIDAGVLREWVKNYWSQSRDSAMQLILSAGRSGGSVLLFLANMLLVPVVTFYLLRDWDILVARIRGLIPTQHEPMVVRLAGEADEVLGSFILGQMWVMFGLSVVYSLGLWMVGLEFALLIGLVAGMVSFVPYLGAAVGIVVATVMMWFQTGSFIDLLLVWLVFGVGQSIESMFLTPLLVGDKIGLHPVAVIFAVLAGGQLFGFFGILLALPVAAVVAVMVRHVVSLYLGSHWYDSAPAVKSESE